jgi:hypothetical protein
LRRRTGKTNKDLEDIPDEDVGENMHEVVVIGLCECEVPLKDLRWVPEIVTNPDLDIHKTDVGQIHNTHILVKNTNLEKLPFYWIGRHLKTFLWKTFVKTFAKTFTKTFMKTFLWKTFHWKTFRKTLWKTF